MFYIWEMKNLIVSLSLVVLCLSTSIVFSQTTFTGAISDDWAEAGNWDNGLPAIGNEATIPSGSNVVTAGFISNGGGIVNYGTIFNDGTIDNGGTIDNDDGATSPTMTKSTTTQTATEARHDQPLTLGTTSRTDKQSKQH